MQSASNNQRVRIGLSTLSDQLNRHFDEAEAAGGLSTLHLLNLPSAINRVLRLFLRHKEISYSDLQKSLADLPPDSRLTYAELDEMLEVLCQREWLVHTEQNGISYYGINLRPAVASATTKSSSVSEEQKLSAEELWKKAALETEAGVGKTAGQVHQEISGAGSQDEHLPDEQSDTPSIPAPDTGDDKVSADDLWDVLG